MSAIPNIKLKVADQNNKIVFSFGEDKPDEDADNDGEKFTLNLRFPGQYYDKEIMSQSLEDIFNLTLLGLRVVVILMFT